MRKLFIIFISFALLITAFSSYVFAQEFRHDQERSVLKQNETINKDYFSSGKTVVVSGTVNGDVYAAGGTVLVDGTINGDLFAAGGNITIRGKISNDIRVAGGNITISSPVGGNVTILGGNGIITENADIKGSVVSGTGSLQIFGPVGKGISAGVGNLTIGNQVGGDVVAGVGQLSLTKDASLNGDIDYYSNNKASIPSGATVSGKVNQHIPIKQNKTDLKNAAKYSAAGFISFIAISDIIISFIFGILFLKFLPIFTKTATEIVPKHPWRSFGIGLIFLIILPIIGVIFFFTIIGIPLAILFFISMFLLLYFGKIFVAYLVGGRVLKVFNPNRHDFWALLIGIVVFVIVAWVPVIGALLISIASIIGMGAILNTKKNIYLQLRNKKLL